MKQLLGCALALVALCLSGCMRTNTLVAVKKDGSGAISVTLLMSKEAQAQLKEMAGPDKKDKELFTEDEAKAKAATMGEGVTFVSYEKAADGDFSGYKAVYSYTDVTKLKLQPAEGPGGGGPGGPEKKDVIHFGFEKGDKAKLTVFLDGNKAKEKPPEAAPGPDEKQMMEMMKQMFKGMRMEFAIQVEGKPETEVDYVAEDVVTLMSVDFDKVMASEAGMKAIQDMDKNPKAGAEALSKIEGIKFVAEEKVEISFQ